MSVETDRSSPNGRAEFPDTGTSQDQEDRVSAAVAEFIENRAVIEQAKGMLMLVYGIDPGRAFELLRWHSQQYNLKLRLVAEEVAESFIHLSQTTPVANRFAYDNLLARIARSADTSKQR